MHIDRAEPDSLMDHSGSESYDNAFHAELSGAEVDDAPDWAGLGGRLVKEGNAWDIEEADAATTLLRRTPFTPSLDPSPTTRRARGRFQRHPGVSRSTG